MDKILRKSSPLPPFGQTVTGHTRLCNVPAFASRLIDLLASITLRNEPHFFALTPSNTNAHCNRTVPCSLFRCRSRFTLAFLLGVSMCRRKVLQHPQHHILSTVPHMEQSFFQYHTIDHSTQTCATCLHATHSAAVALLYLSVCCQYIAHLGRS